MNSSCSVIPDLVLLEDYGGDYFKFENAIYEFFKIDFLESKPAYNNQNLALKRHPLFKEKEATFWHIISEGPMEVARTPDIRRYERIQWPKKMIEYCNANCEKIKVWANIRKGEKRILLWCEDVEYLVVLADRKEYILFWTSYPVTENHRKRKLQKEYEEYVNHLL